MGNYWDFSYVFEQTSDYQKQKCVVLGQRELGFSSTEFTYKRKHT